MSELYGPCAWCQEQSITRHELEPARTDSAGKVIEPARLVDVCERHAAMIDRDLKIAELRRRIPRLRGAVARASGTKRELTETELARVERDLAALEAR